MDPIANLPKPLNIPRKDLIDALQKRADEEETKRKEQQDKIDTANKAAVDAIKTFTPEELYEIFAEYFTVDAEALQKHKASDRFKPEEMQPTKVETDLERAIRVLKLSSDDTVEVPTKSDLYSLL